MSLFAQADFAGHEAVHYFHDAASGLKAIIAIHDTRLGPAIGGCRMWDYASDEDALIDVLRLSEGMTYKAAMADLPFGGGKSVIVGNAKTDKTPELFKAFARAVHSLNGQYYTGEDVGTSPADMAHAGTITPYVLGREERGSSGDPSPFTAKGVVLGIEAALAAKFGNSQLQGRTIAIQGLGAVGMPLAFDLHNRGAILKVADLDTNQLRTARRELNAEIIEGDAILTSTCDVLAPCALGAVINPTTIGQLNCKIIAGSANNQLATPKMGDALHTRGVLYAPDYVINAGGLINIANELTTGGYNRQRALKALNIIPKRLGEIFQTARDKCEPEHSVADKMAKEIVARGPKVERKAA